MTTTTTSNRLDVFDRIALGLLNTVWALGASVVAFPMISIPLALAVTVSVLVGPRAGVGVVGVFAAGMLLWRAKHPETFQRWITSRARTRVLTWCRYTRCWARLLTACHLSLTTDDKTTVPRLLGVQIGERMDRVRVRMLPGQCPADYENRVSHLAHAFGAQECRATITAPATVELVFRHTDSLAETVVLPRRGDGQRWGKGQAA